MVVTLVVPEISIQADTGQIPQELDFDIKIYKKEVSWGVQMRKGSRTRPEEKLSYATAIIKTRVSLVMGFGS